MAWQNQFKPFWEARGEGVDHAPPPPPGLPPFMNPDFWNRWAMGPPGEGPWGHGPHGHHHDRRWGGRRGDRHWPGEDEPVNEGSGSDDNEVYPPEYISDDEAAYAAAAAEVEGKRQNSTGKQKETETEKSPDTTMQDHSAADPPEEIPDADEDRRQRRGPGRSGRCGGRGFGGRGHRGSGGFGPQGRRHGGRRGGFEHRGPPPSFPPFFPFGRPHGPPAHGAQHPPSFPPPPPFFEAFFGGAGESSDGDNHPPPPPHFHGRHRHDHPRGPHSRRHRGPHPPPPPPPGAEGQGPFDFRGMMGALANHPYAHHLRHFLERAQQPPVPNQDREGTPDSDDMDATTITPPLDLFDQPDKWVLHLAMPGAKKQDTGVHWDADRSVLSISGVVHRPGDEEFQQTLVTGERRVGLFSREVRLPPVGTALGETGEASKEEVNSDEIVAKMEDGILIVTVPKVEKDWTEVKRVEIE